MIPDFASWADHSNPEQGRTAGLILDLSRLRAEFVEPEMRFRKALEGIDLNGPCDLATPLTKAIDEMEYEMAVAVCSTRALVHQILTLSVLTSYEQVSFRPSTSIIISSSSASSSSLRESTFSAPVQPKELTALLLTAGPNATASRSSSNKVSKVRCNPCDRGLPSSRRAQIYRQSWSFPSHTRFLRIEVVLSFSKIENDFKGCTPSLSRGTSSRSR